MSNATEERHKCRQMEGKYNDTLGKLDAFMQGKSENDRKDSQILTQKTELQSKLGTLSEDVIELKNSIAYIRERCRG